MKFSVPILATLIFLWVAVAAEAPATVLPAFNFAQPGTTNGWWPAHDIDPFMQTEQGLSVRISGPDPYLIGPPTNFPPGLPLWLRIRLRSDAGGMGQVFYSSTGFTEAQSVRFAVPQAQWYEAKVKLPALGSGCRIRIDPPGDSGSCTIAWVRFEPRLIIASHRWPTPSMPTVEASDPRIKSGALEIVHGRHAPGQFHVVVNNKLMAVGNTNSLLGYVFENEPKWIALTTATNSSFQVQLLKQNPNATQANRIDTALFLTDPNGGRWHIEQSFSCHGTDVIRIVTTVTVSQERDVFYLPILTLLAGLGSYGTNKTQALFAGVEYLENEPSSSTADLNPPASNRQVPDTSKITFPLIAMVADGCFVGLSWKPDRSQTFCAVFDSPDRVFHSGAHLIGLLFPGSDGNNRDESSLIPYETVRLAPNQPLRLEAFVTGGAGTTVVPAVQKYLEIFGLPPLPTAGISSHDYLTLAAMGWLRSSIREVNKSRHAVPGFPASPSADAALYMHYLATCCVTNPALARELDAAHRSAIAEVPPNNYNSAQIGHVRYPVPPLIFGSVEENITLSIAHGKNLMSRFASDGTVFYTPPASGPDYSRTHWSKEANGLAATYVHALLEEASFNGDREQIEAALRHLRELDKFRHTVPRGAQTWEIPLHTPDILASAYLVRAYVRGYELTGDHSFLELARYWAWT
ncbi:MAG: hypothetical protein N3G20_09385, partial [Verrucomicrobiae bacterium]|nr:hypothetical protein [Verrucomicrobiae bacterium]